jgi:RimJ/RimL family protein N-acetyltransferase
MRDNEAIHISIPSPPSQGKWRNEMKLPIIKTKRLILKALTDMDAEALFEYRAASEIHQYQIWKPKTLKEVQDFIKKYTQDSM